MKSGLAWWFVLFALSLGSCRMQADAHEIGQKTAERRVVMVPINDFSLIDQNSRGFNFSKLTGRVTVVAFAYTTCPDVCPLLTAALREVQSGLTQDESKKVFLLTITTDPEIDSPKVLVGYAKRYGVDFANWSFLSGDPQALQKVWKNFGVGVKRKARGLVDHTPLIAVIDRQNNMRLAYIGPAPAAKTILHDVRDLLRQ